MICANLGLKTFNTLFQHKDYLQTKYTSVLSYVILCSHENMVTGDGYHNHIPQITIDLIWVQINYMNTLLWPQMSKDSQRNNKGQIQPFNTTCNHIKNW